MSYLYPAQMAPLAALSGGEAVWAASSWLRSRTWPRWLASCSLRLWPDRELGYSGLWNWNGRCGHVWGWVSWATLPSQSYCRGRAGAGCCICWPRCWWCPPKSPAPSGLKSGRDTRPYHRSPVWTQTASWCSPWPRRPGCGESWWRTSGTRSWPSAGHWPRPWSSRAPGLANSNKTSSKIFSLQDGSYKFSHNSHRWYSPIFVFFLFESKHDFLMTYPRL